MIRSLHHRLLLLVGACSAATLAISGIIVCLLVESQLWSQFDGALRDRLYNLTQLVEQDTEKVDFEWNESEALSTPLLDPDARVTCWCAGQVIEVVPDGATPLPKLASSPASKVHSIVLDGQPARAAVIQFVPRTEGSLAISAPKTVTVAIARPTQSVLSVIKIIRWSLVAAAAFGMLLTSLGAWIAVARGLLPIRLATSQIARVTPECLNRKIDEISTQPVELQPLLSTINQLLDQLRIAMDRERALSSEIAHELRTPLAGLRAKLDVALSRPRSATELQQTIQECSGIVEQTSSMIENLMATIVAASGTTVAGESVKLSAIIEEIILQFDERMTERGLSVIHHIDEGVFLPMGELSARTVINNLVDNAVCYADADTVIDLECQRVGDVAHFRIRNHVRDFPEGQVERVFERFWRVDDARSNSEHHSGLGLALAKRLVELSSGRIEARYQAPWFEVAIYWNSLN